MTELYPLVFKKYIAKGIELNRLNTKLAEFDLDLLGKAIKCTK
jgi:hypothetical protein